MDDAKGEIIVMGDLNGRIGSNNKGVEEYMGTEGEKVQNGNGKRIIEMCRNHQLIIANTKFTHKDIHKVTWERKKKQEKSIIDYFLIDKQLWDKVKDVRVYRGHEIGSDHYLLKATLSLRKKENVKEIKRTSNEKIRSYKLKDIEIRNKYQERLEEALRGIESINKGQTLWEMYKKAVINTGKEICGTVKIKQDNVKKNRMVERRN